MLFPSTLPAEPADSALSTSRSAARARAAAACQHPHPLPRSAPQRAWYPMHLPITWKPCALRNPRSRVSAAHSRCAAAALARLLPAEQPRLEQTCERLLLHRRLPKGRPCARRRRAHGSRAGTRAAQRGRAAGAAPSVRQCRMQVSEKTPLCGCCGVGSCDSVDRIWNWNESAPRGQQAEPQQPRACGRSRERAGVRARALT